MNPIECVEVCNVSLLGPFPVDHPSMVYCGAAPPTERRALIHVQVDETHRLRVVRLDFKDYIVLHSDELARLRFWDVPAHLRKVWHFLVWATYPVRHPVGWFRQARRFKRDAQKMLSDAVNR